MDNRIVEALEFYADTKHYCNDIAVDRGDGKKDYSTSILEDNGNQAKQALAALRKMKNPTVVDGERLNNLVTIHYFDAGRIQEIKANPAGIRAYLRREEEEK